MANEKFLAAESQYYNALSIAKRDNKKFESKTPTTDIKTAVTAMITSAETLHEAETAEGCAKKHRHDELSAVKKRNEIKYDLKEEKKDTK